ncbi:MAG: DUF2971 domain-containing protein [Clostridia bacterium]|nr:DUF2971 domain-containing protein [Clostridia bacterium]
MKLYKYTSFEIGKSVIETSKIALSKPEWFNDPFDASPVINQNELQKAIDILNGYLLDMNVFRMLRVLKRQLTQQKQHALVSSVLMEYRTAQKQAETRPGLYTPIFTFDRLEILFNSFEKIGRLTAEQVQAKENMLLLRRRMEKNEWETLTEIISARNNMYVCCLSEVCDSILMWAYYGQDHRGVCIEVEVDENGNDFAKVKYQIERPAMQMEKVMRDFCGKMFAKLDVSNLGKDPTLLPLVAEPYITKSKEWEHERECRLVYFEKAHSNGGLEKCMCRDGKERYMRPVKITKVFCGANMSDENKNAIRAIVPREIEVVEMKISDTKYELLTDK